MISRRVGLIAAIAAAGCSGGGGDDAGTAMVPNARGTLSVALMDAPVDEAFEVNVEITSAWLKPAGAGPAFELPLANGPLRVNLLELDDQNAAVLVDDAIVPAGEYKWLAIDVNATNSAVVTSTGMHPLRVPSDRVRLVGGFEVGDNDAVRLLVDWQLRTALVRPPGLGGTYLLRPAFRVLEVEELGVLAGTVEETLFTAASCGTVDAGNVVFVFEADVTDDDLTGPYPEPVATADVALRDGEYRYRVVLAPGDYRVAFTCQAELESDTLEFTALQPATVAVGVPAEVNF